MTASKRRSSRGSLTRLAAGRGTRAPSSPPLCLPVCLFACVPVCETSAAPAQGLGLGVRPCAIVHSAEQPREKKENGEAQGQRGEVCSSQGARQGVRLKQKGPNALAAVVRAAHPTRPSLTPLSNRRLHTK
eukprot:scaffold3393_cov101-Isochrysis_galbana.AAC.1